MSSRKSLDWLKGTHGWKTYSLSGMSLHEPLIYLTELPLFNRLGKLVWLKVCENVPADDFENKFGILVSGDGTMTMWIFSHVTCCS